MKKALLEALLKVQKSVPAIKKNAKGFNYKYADLPKVWESIKSVIQENGFVVTHEITAEGLKTTAWHEHGELNSMIPFTVDGMKPQEIGSEITYYRRYNISSIFNLIIEGEDDDAKTAQSKVIVPKEDFGRCSSCNMPNVKSKATGKIYCGAKCWLTPPRPLPGAQAIIDELDAIPVVTPQK